MLLDAFYRNSTPGFIFTFSIVFLMAMYAVWVAYRTFGPGKR